MTHRITCAIAMALALSVCPSAVAWADSPSTAPPFNECPAVGEDTGCGVLIIVNDGGTRTLTDPNQGAYDGADDTLVGVLNNSSSVVSSLPLAGSDIFGFDDDGLCADDNAPAGCPFGDTGYEGPGTVLTPDPDSSDSGTVSFNGGLAPGASTYFSLEGPTSSLVPQPPTALTGAASDIATDAASITGTVDPNGEPTTYYFEYGLDDGYGSQTPEGDVDGAPPETGSAARPVSAALDSLDPGTTYHYRLVASNDDGTSYGDDQALTTKSLPSAAYVAFGDSYSSGEGLGPPWTHPYTVCHRSFRGYPLLLVSDLQISSDADLACTGATTNDFYVAQRDQHGNRMQPAQFDLAAGQAGPDTKLVTLTVGGDDLGFAPVLRDCVAASAVRSLPTLAVAWVSCKRKDKGAVAKRLAALRGDPSGRGARTPHKAPIHPLTTVLADIASRAPDATIVIGNYPQLFPADLKRKCQVGSWSGHYSLGVLASDARWLNSVGSQLNRAISDAAANARVRGLNVRVADAASVFRGHEIACGTKGDNSHWIQRLNVSSHVHIGWRHFDVQPADVDPGSFHPTASGQGAYEQAFLGQSR